VERLKILVLCGGKSAEHAVSLVSARTVLANLDGRRYAANLVYIGRRGVWWEARSEGLTARVGARSDALLEGSRPLSPFAALAAADAVFPVLHGPMGEDGTVQGLLELAGVPYVGCGVLGSALSMDKELTKKMAAQAGLPILPYRALNRPEFSEAQAGKLGYPVFVKPARMGSSVGVSKVSRPRDLRAALKDAFRYDDKVLVEKGVPAREIECALLGDPWAAQGDGLALEASICGEIEPNAEFYSYDAKYLDPDGAKLKVPAAIPARLAGRVRDLAKEAFRVLDGYGMARADFLMDRRSGAVYFNEINTIPGFTAISMYPRLWKASGVETPELIGRLIELALRRHRRRPRLKTTP
jgi:D-alanine-D-alanine ligase